MDFDTALRTTPASTLSSALTAPEPATAPPRLLNLDYAPEIPDKALADMESIARDAGMPLAQIELLGQDATACWEFTHLSKTAGVAGAILHTDWMRLENILETRRQFQR